jgi:hydroxyacylglutathione hydrolase
VREVVLLIRQIVDERLAQYAYLVGCQATKEALLVDPERDIDRYLEIARREGLSIVGVAETHIHADFLSGAREFAHRFPEVRLYLSDEGGPDWTSEWARRDGANAQFLRHGDRFSVGNIDFEALHTPGHTPEHVAYLVTDRGAGADRPMGLLSGDFVFVGDLGRPDLLETAAGVAGAREPSARRLFESARTFLDFDDWIQIWPAHGAGSACGKALGAIPQSTVGYERRFSPALAAAARGESAFVDFILDGQPEPPLYFATMKRLNKEGAPVLGRMPTPRSLGAADAVELAALAVDPTVVVVDTRLPRTIYQAAHLRGSLYAPLDKSFNTVAGSYLRPDDRIVLIVEEARRDEAVRDLVRVGLDRVEAWVGPEVIDRPELDSLRVATRLGSFEQLEALRTQQPVAILDTRGAVEHAARSIPGEVNIAHTRLASRLGDVPGGADEPVWVHCGLGARAAVAASWLERAGREVVLVDEAFANWRGHAAH